MSIDMNLNDFLFEALDDIDEQAALIHCLQRSFIFLFASSGCADHYCLIFFICTRHLEIEMNAFTSEKQTFNIIGTQASQVGI